LLDLEKIKTEMSGQGREQQRVQVKKKHRSIDDLMYNLQLHQIKYVDNSTTFSYQLGLMILHTELGIMILKERHLELADLQKYSKLAKNETLIHNQTHGLSHSRLFRRKESNGPTKFSE
jgi:hypothetical protein